MAKVRNEVSLTFCYQTAVFSSKPILLPIAPFTIGQWSCTYDPTRKVAEIKCTGVTKSVNVQSVRLKTSIDQKGDYCDLIKDSGLGQVQSKFPPQADWKIWAAVKWPKGQFGHAYPGRATLEIVLSAGVDPAEAVTAPAAVTAGPVGVGFDNSGQGNERAVSRAMAVSAKLGVPASGDALIYFPASRDKLYVDSAALKLSSPYFATHLGPLITSEDSDAFSVVGTEAFFTSDADDQAVEALASSVSSLTTVDHDEMIDTPAATAVDHPKIVIDNHSYDAFHAVVVWILSGYIAFAPLPVRSLSSGSAIATPQPSADLAHGLPAAIPAATVVQLATLLQLPDLVSLAVDKYKSQLTVDNVISELTSDAALLAPIKEIILAFASQQWKTVKQTPLALHLQKPGVLAAFANSGEVGARLFELAGRC